MHPDQATDAVIEVALALKKPFAVVPCCVFTDLFPHRRLKAENAEDEGVPVQTYAQLCEYLRSLHPDIEVAFLPFKGRNQVLYWRPRE